MATSYFTLKSDFQEKQKKEDNNDIVLRYYLHDDL